MNESKEDIIDDASETTEDFESDDEKNDIDDLEEDKIINDDELDDSDNESHDYDGSVEENDEDENIDEHDINNSLLQGGETGEEEDDDDDDESLVDDNDLKKFNNSVKNDLISQFHPEMMEHNEKEIKLMSTVVRDTEGRIIDKLHRSIPFVTKYEKARIIGERTRQLNSGAIPFIVVEPDIIDGYLIAVEEFNKKKIPFIIKRPLPSGKCEYWKLSDLEIM
jgi:DNA-directed RNA polymerase I, II, and III subunit RPABC2